MADFDWSQIVELTDYNTISGIYGNNFKEISINRFLKKLEKSIDNGNDFRRFDHNTFIFWYPDLYKTFYLCLDETLMANFDKGFYTPFTKELKRLLDKKEKMDKKKSLLELASKQSSLAEEIDKEALPLYLSEKRKDLGFSLDDIKDYFKNLKNELNNAKYDTRNALNNKIWPYYNFGMGVAFLGSSLFSMFLAIPAVALSTANNNFWFLLITLIPQGIVYTVPALTYLYNYGKTRINRLINFVDRRKYAKEEIKSLTETNPEIKLIADDKDNEEKYIMLDEKEEITELTKKDDNLEISKLILQKIASITRSLKNITNEEEKIRIALKIQNILNKSNECFYNVDASNGNGKLIVEGLEFLRLKMIPQIEEIEKEIELILNKQTGVYARTQMFSEIQNSLNEIISGRQLKKDNGNH